MDFFYLFRSNVREQNLYKQIEDMSWSDLPSTPNSISSDGCHTSQGDCNATKDFDDIEDSSFHGDHSLLMDVSVAKSNDFSDIANSSFREIENISLDDDQCAVDDLIRNQVGRGQNDYNIKMIKEKNAKKYEGR